MKTLVIDVGTTGVRSAIVHADGTLSDLHYRANPPHSPAPGMVEFDAMHLADLVVELATASMQGHDVAAVGITCQRASTIVWRTTTGAPVGPGIGWQDLRTVGECIMARHTHGVAVAPNQTATKAAWLLANCVDEKERDSADIRIGTVDSWLTWVLTRGERHVTDHSNAAVTGLTDPTGRTWDEKACAAFGLSPAQLPRIVCTMDHVGEAVALPGAPPITALVGDQQASLVGQGCITEGAAKITFGTGGMLDVFTGRRPPASNQRLTGGTFPIVAFSRSDQVEYGIEAIMLSAGSNVEWLCHDMGLIDTPADSDAIAASCASSDGVVYVPALVGLGTPHWDYGARGSLFGLTRGTTRAHVVRAVLEGVAHRGADLIEAAETDGALRIDEVRIDGGMSRNATFVQALADASGRSVKVSTHTEATTIGAGFLAGTQAGQWSHLDEAVATVTWSKTVDPLGNREQQRQQWNEAVSRAKAWIPDLSALDF